MKKIVSLLIILVTMIFIGNSSFAYTNSKEIVEISSIKVATKVDEDLGDLNNYAKPNSVNIGPKLEDKVGKFLGVIRAVGTIISVGVLMVIGIKYMLASVEEKAEYKKTFMAYVIGAFLLFATTTLPEVIYSLVIDL